MLHRVYTVYDSKAEAYLAPFYFQTNGQSLRAFTDACNDPNHAFYKHPSDYTLFFLGEYDDGTATFIMGTKVSMGTAIEFRTQREIPFGDTELPHLSEVSN